MRIVLATVLFSGMLGCATIRGETTILHPSMVGDKESYISIRVKDNYLPYMKFNHIAGMSPKTSDDVIFMVRTFSTVKDQIDPRQNNFYLVDDQGVIYKPSVKQRINIIEKRREVTSTHDVAGQVVRIKTPDGIEYFQMHHLQDVNTEIYYYYGYCELAFYNQQIIKPDTKSLTLVAEQDGRKIKFVWHITKNPSEASPDLIPEFKTQDNWGNHSRFLPENNPGSQRVVPNRLQ